MKNKLSLIGLYQALGLTAYCSLVAGLIFFLSSFMDKPDPQILNMVFVLLLLSFSVAICGLIVFGYPISLVIKGKIKDALTLLAYTLLYCFGFLAIILVINSL